MNFLEKYNLPEFSKLSFDEYVINQLKSIVDKYENKTEYSNGLCGCFALATHIYFEYNGEYTALNVASESSKYWGPVHAFVTILGYNLDHMTLRSSFEKFSFCDDGEGIETDLTYLEFSHDVKEFKMDYNKVVKLVGELHELLQLNKVDESDVLNAYEHIMNGEEFDIEEM